MNLGVMGRAEVLERSSISWDLDNGVKTNDVYAIIWGCGWVETDVIKRASDVD